MVSPCLFSVTVSLYARHDEWLILPGANRREEETTPGGELFVCFLGNLFPAVGECTEVYLWKQL